MADFFAWHWLRYYVVTGLVLFSVLRITAVWLHRTRGAQTLRQELISTYLPKAALDWRDALTTMAMLPLIAVVWPVVLVWGITVLCSPNAAWRSKLAAATFCCKPQYLRKPITQAEAEMLDLVIDPLGRAPALPFGHLNAGWLAFLGKEAEGFALWYFEISREPAPVGGLVQPVWLCSRGFAWVKAREVQAEFVFEG